MDIHLCHRIFGHRRVYSDPSFYALKNAILRRQADRTVISDCC